VSLLPRFHCASSCVVGCNVKISSQYPLAVATENVTTRAESNHSVANIYVDITTVEFLEYSYQTSNTVWQLYILDFPAPTRTGRFCYYCGDVPPQHESNRGSGDRARAVTAGPTVEDINRPDIFGAKWMFRASAAGIDCSILAQRPELLANHVQFGNGLI
jgi:hypothetical protein